MPTGLTRIYLAHFAGDVLKADKIVMPEGDIIYAIYRCTIGRCGTAVNRTSELVSFLEASNMSDKKVL